MRPCLRILLGTLLLGSVNAEAAPTFLTGEVAVMRVSGKLCASDVYERMPQIDLVLDRSIDGKISGYYVIEGVKIGKFSGTSPSRLEVVYPVAERERAQGHLLSLELGRDPVAGTLKEKGIGDDVEGCAIEVGELRLSAFPEEDARAWQQRTEKSYRAQGLGSEALGELKAQHPDKAVALYQKALALEEEAQGQGSALAILYLDALADAYGKNNDFDKGIALLEPRVAAANDPEKRFYSESLAQLLNQKGSTSYRAGKYAEALPAFKRAMELDPAITEYPAAAVRTLIKLKRFEDAANLLNQMTPLYTEQTELDQVRKELEAVQQKR